jgi:tetratricopeptide (TPR) repeat protein
MASCKRRVPAASNSKALEAQEPFEAFLESWLEAEDFLPAPDSTPLEQAQMLVYQAWSESAPERRIQLARQALNLSPDCADAYVLLAEEANTVEEALQWYQQGVGAGERVLPADWFERYLGRFWHLPEARPYLRARLGLAQSLWLCGHQEDALSHLWELLRLDAADHQGARYLLLEALLIRNDIEALRTLLDMYPDDESAAWTYSRVLVLYQHEGDTLETRQALRRARQANPHVPAYLLGQKKLPRQLPEHITPGEEDEAIDYASVALPYWKATPGVCNWLKRQLSRSTCR